MEMPLEDVPIKRVRLNGESSLSTPSSAKGMPSAFDDGYFFVIFFHYEIEKVCGSIQFRTLHSMTVGNKT
jgi:hypothetical protein